MKDSDILALLKDGNEKAFSYLYEKMWQRLFDNAYRRLPDEDVVKGLIQDLFVELWQKRANIEIHTSFASYLNTALKYKIFNYIKSHQIREKYKQKQLLFQPALHNPIEDKLSEHELQVAFNKCLVKIPQKCKTVFLLRLNQGLSYAEIAQTLNISKSTVEKHMIKSFKILRRHLQSYLYSVFAIVFPFFI